MRFKSQHPDIELPNITVWDWAFESKKYSPIHKYPPDELAGYTNAVTKERLNWLQVKEYATYLSTALYRKYGLRETETVSLFSQNTIWYPVAQFATLRVGGRVNGASPAYNTEEMSFALKTAQTRFLMTVPNSIDVAFAAAKNAGIPKEHVFLLEGEHDGFTTMKELLQIGKSYGNDGQAPEYRIPTGVQSKDICGFLNFSSGTTGLPKAVMLSHQNVIAQCLQLDMITHPDHARKTLACTPLFHITGLVRFIACPVAFNDECYMLPAFSMEGMLNAIVEYQIADFTFVPPIIIRLVRDPIVDKYDLSCMKRFSSGSAPISHEIIQLLEKKFPGTGFKQGYGATESTACISSHPPDKYSYRYANTGGTLVASTIGKIIDEKGKELGYNEVGEICAQGPQIAMGYLGNEKATKESFDEEHFLHTGDIGSIDEEGFIHVVDRIKEMIKVKGQQVAPAELEDLLQGHPLVTDCAVLGLPDSYSGERPKAYVVPKPDTPPTEALGRQLIKYVKDKKVRYKWIVELEFVDAIPKNPSGKILRRVLKERERERERSRGGGTMGLIVRDERERARL